MQMLQQRERDISTGCREYWGWPAPAGENNGDSPGVNLLTRIGVVVEVAQAVVPELRCRRAVLHRECLWYEVGLGESSCRSVTAGGAGWRLTTGLLRFSLTVLHIFLQVSPCHCLASAHSRHAVRSGQYRHCDVTLATVW